MVGEWGQCDADHPAPAFWQDVEYEYVGALFFCKVCRAGPAFREAAHMEGREVSKPAGNLSGDQFKFCQCQGKHF